MELPSWLRETTTYVPLRDRDSFLRRNVLVLTELLAVFRASTAATPSSPLDRALAGVAPAIRLMGTVVLIALVSAARNLAFCWAVLAGFLVLLAARPPKALAAVLKPAVALALLAALVNLPAALLLHQASAPLRLALKSFLTAGLAANMAQALGLSGVLDSLRALHLPAQLVFTVEMAVRDLGLLGEAAHSLAEALELRSIGQSADKTAGTAGVLGATFLRGQRLAAGQAEAMLLRGYDGSSPAARTTHRFTWCDAAYLAALAALVVLFIYLETVLKSKL